MLCEEFNLESRSLTPCSADTKGHLEELKGLRLPDDHSTQWESDFLIASHGIRWAHEGKGVIWRQESWAELQAVCATELLNTHRRKPQV